MRWLLPALAVLSGCTMVPVVAGTAEQLEETALELRDAEPATFCNLPCIGPVNSELPIRCADFAANLLTARRILSERGIVPAAQFCAAFEAVPVKVLASDRASETTVGDYSATGGVTLARDGRALAHELIHHWELRHWNLLTGSHPSWSELGRWGADGQFRVAAVALAD